MLLGHKRRHMSHLLLLFVLYLTLSLMKALSFLMIHPLKILFFVSGTWYMTTPYLATLE
jgi:hypothetical protein